jgi:two-component system, LuxR family, response regulator FixJ
MPDHTIYVIDDSPDVRDSLEVLLDVAGYRCLTFASALEFLDAVRPDWTGCAVADVRMPGMTGIELQAELVLRGIHLPVIVITAHADVPMAVAALKAGAADFIEKPFREEVLLSAIHAALSLPAVDAARPAPGAAVSARLSTLSAREREVMLLLVAGNPNKSVASRLGISARTVEVHRARIMEKTGAKSLADLVRMACFYDTDGPDQP